MMADGMATDAGAGQSQQAAAVPAVDVDAMAFVCDDASGQAIARFFSPEQAAQRVRLGGVAAAVQYLSANASPKLLLVDLSDSEVPMNDIDALAEVCDPNMTVITLGSANDVTLYRELHSAGVADYLVKPLTDEMLRDALGKVVSTIKSKGVDKDAGGLITVIGARGGIGASAIASNLACILSQEAGKKVGLIDLDLQFGTIALSLDVEAGIGLREALDDPGHIDSLFLNSVATRVGEHLYVLATEETVGERIQFEANALDAFLSEMRKEFDYLVIDIPRAVAVAHWLAIGKSTSLILISDLSLAALRDTSRLISVAKAEIDAKNLYIVANRVGADKRNEIDPREFERAIERKIDFFLPDDSKTIAAALNAGKSLSEIARGAKITGVLRQMCDRIVRGDGARKSV